RATGTHVRPHARADGGTATSVLAREINSTGGGRTYSHRRRLAGPRCTRPVRGRLARDGATGLRGPRPAGDRVEHEGGALRQAAAPPRRSLPGDPPAGGSTVGSPTGDRPPDDLAHEPHPQPLHHRAGAAVVPFGTRHHVGGAELVEGERQRRPADLRTVPAPPAVPPDRPAHLQADPSIHFRPGEPAPADQLTGGALVGHPFVHPGAPAGRGPAGGPPPRPAHAVAPAEPGRRRRVLMHPPQVLGVLRTDRL